MTERSEIVANFIKVPLQNLPNGLKLIITYIINVIIDKYLDKTTNKNIITGIINAYLDNTKNKKVNPIITLNEDEYRELNMELTGICI